MICKIKNIQTGEIRTIGLPKGRKELNAFLMDIGLNEGNGYAHEMVEVRTRSKAVNEVLLQRNLTVDEMNAFAYIYMNTRGYWDRDFIRALNVEKPKTVKDFLTVAAEVPFYHFFEASTLEQVGEIYIKLTPSFDGSMTAKQVGEMMCKFDSGKFVGDNLYYVKKINLEDYVPVYYNGMSLETRMDEEEKDGVMLLRISEKVQNPKEKNAAVPSLEIVLPTTEYEIKRALHRFGEAQVTTEYIDIHKSHIPLIFKDGEDVLKLNECAELWKTASFEWYEQDKMSAVSCIAEETDFMDEFISAFDKLHVYKYYPGIDSVDELEECDLQLLVTLPEGKSKTEIAKEVLEQFEHDFIEGDILVKTDGEEGLEKYFDIEFV